MLFLLNFKTIFALNYCGIQKKAVLLHLLSQLAVTKPVEVFSCNCKYWDPAVREYSGILYNFCKTHLTK